MELNNIIDILLENDYVIMIKVQKDNTEIHVYGEPIEGVKEHDDGTVIHNGICGKVIEGIEGNNKTIVISDRKYNRALEKFKLFFEPIAEIMVTSEINNFIQNFYDQIKSND